MMVTDNIQLLYIDLFCGAGGTSTGVEKAIVDGKKCAKVIACVNHDPNAIASHNANHPNTLHFIEDIRTLEMSRIMPHVESQKARHPNAHVVLWASLNVRISARQKADFQEMQTAERLPSIFSGILKQLSLTTSKSRMLRSSCLGAILMSMAIPLKN